MMIQGYIKLFIIFITATAVLYLPIFFALKKKDGGLMRRSSYLLCLWSLFLIVFATIILFNLPISFSPERHILNIRPFQWLYEGSIKQRVMTEIRPNVMIFIPLGFFTPMAFKRMRKIYITAPFVFAVTFCIEFFQYFIGRSADIDDLIANLMGGIIGYGLFRLFDYSLLCRCLAILAAGMLAISFTVDANQQPNAQPSADLISNIDIDVGLNADVQSDEETAWYLILVNKWNYAPEDYNVELTELSNGQSVDKRIYPSLQAMLDAARNDGVYPVVVSGYRSTDKQQSLMEEKIAEYSAEGCSAEEASAKAEAWVAIPGTSEHQLGIAVDINADGIQSAGGEVYEWLGKNAHRFGFICRYPADKTKITGVINEPWHYRYVGVKAAGEIYNQNICLEEYLDLCGD